MKKIKFLISGLVVCSLISACQKSNGGSEDIDDKPAKVTLGANMNSVVSATKAGVDSWNKEKLYLYAFPTNRITDNADSILLNNVYAAAPASGGGTAQPIVVADSLGHSFYYSADKRTYDFFAYYVDGAAGATPSPTITPGSDVTLPITIDGSYDVMLATTDKEEDIKEAGASLAPTDVYSAYSARKNVVPNLIFEHQLSRFVFRIIAGTEEAKFIKIDSITLRSCSKGDLVIVKKNGRGISNPSDLADLVLKAKTGKISDFEPKYKGSIVFDDNDRIGESIMVIPSDVHHMEIHMVQYTDSSRGDTVGGPFSYKYDLTTKMVETTVPHPDNKFLTGYRYNVNVVVYGLKKVEVKVTLSPWDDGGTITIDNEEEWGDEPSIGVKSALVGKTDSTYLYFYGGIAVNSLVKVWNKTANEMNFAPAGDYNFSIPRGDTTGVVLTKKGTTDTTYVSSVKKQQP